MRMAGVARMSARSLNVTHLATVNTVRQRWAAEDLIPLGTVSILAGRAGIAKSTILAWFIAKWTSGDLRGDLYGTPVSIAIVNGEDDLSAVLVPRLTAAGADLSRVVSISTVTVEETDGEDWITSPTLSDDLQAIRRALVETGARVLIIDPIVSLMRGDSHRLDDVRRNLDPLASMASELGIAVVCVAHFNKGQGQAGDMVSGSHAFRDIARSLLLLAVDDETDERILTVEKSNYSQVKPSLAFGVETVQIATTDGEQASVGRARLHGDANVTVHDLINRERDQRPLGDGSNKVIEHVNLNPDGVKPDDVAEALGIQPNEARSYLSRLTTAGRIERLRYGVYGPKRNTTTTVASVAVVALSQSATDATTATRVVGTVADDVGYCVGCGGTLPCLRSHSALEQIRLEVTL